MSYETCDWCDDPIGRDEDVITVKAGRVNEMGGVIAQFHAGTCYEEASSYGWRR